MTFQGDNMDDILSKIMDSGSPEISIPSGPQRVIIFKDDPEEKSKVYCLLQLSDTNKIMVIGHMNKSDVKRIGRSM
jgi:hypothetical protein